MPSDAWVWLPAVTQVSSSRMERRPPAETRRTPRSSSTVPIDRPCRLSTSSGTSTRSRKAGLLGFEVLLVAAQGDLVDLATVDAVLAGGRPAVAIMALPVAGSKPKLSHTSPRAWVRSYDLRSGNTPTGESLVRSKVRTPTTSLAPPSTSAAATTTACSPVAQACSTWKPGILTPMQLATSGAVQNFQCQGIVEPITRYSSLRCRHPAQTEDMTHRLAGELADVDLGQGRGLPRREVAAAPGAVWNPRPGKLGDVRGHRQPPFRQFRVES